MNATTKMLDYLMKDSGYNTFSVAQARRLFGIENVSARVSELRQDGWPVYTNTRRRADGSKVSIYRLGRPSKSFKRVARANGVKAINAFA